MNPRTRPLALTLLAVMLSACGTSHSQQKDADMQHPGHGTGTLEQAIGRMTGMRTEILSALDTEIGPRNWAPATNDGGPTGAGCPEEGYDSVALRIYVAKQPYSDSEFARAQEIVEKIARRHGFDDFRVLVDAPDNHAVWGGSPDGGFYQFDSKVAATFSITTGCYRWAHRPGLDDWATIDPTPRS